MEKDKHLPTKPSSSTDHMVTIYLQTVEPSNKHLHYLISKLDEELCTRYPAEEVHGIDFCNPRIDEVLFVIAYDQDSPVACGAIRPIDRFSTELKRFYVEPSSRNKGIAALMLAFLEKKAVELGFRTIRLEMGTEQPEAIQFYIKHGYHAIDCFGDYIGSEFSLCYEKVLKNE